MSLLAVTKYELQVFWKMIRLNQLFKLNEIYLYMILIHVSDTPKNVFLKKLIIKLSN